jgi:hypothetical protein
MEEWREWSKTTSILGGHAGTSLEACDTATQLQANLGFEDMTNISAKKQHLQFYRVFGRDLIVRRGDWQGSVAAIR